MSRARRISAVALAIALGIAATRCSLITSLDGLSGGPDPSAADADADADANAPVSDGSADADASDARQDSGRYCTSLTPAPMFCDDFDDEGPFTRWTETRQSNGGTVTRDRGASRSPPSSLLTTTPAITNTASAALRLTSKTAVRRVRYAYDFRVDAADTTSGYAEVGYLRFGTPDDKQYAVYMRFFSDPSRPTAFTAEAYLPDGGVPQHNFDLAGMPKFTNWMRVDIDFDLRTAPHLTVSVDGVIAGETSLESSLFPPALVTVEAGLGFVGTPSQTWKLRYDNVTVDWEE